MKRRWWSLAALCLLAPACAATRSVSVPSVTRSTGRDAAGRWVAGVVARVDGAARRDGEARSWLVVIDDEAERVDLHVTREGVLHVSRALLDDLEDEAELAALVAHERGHLAAGHGSRDVGPRYTESEERVADEAAERYLAAAGYDPYALPIVVEKLQSEVLRGREVTWPLEHVGEKARLAHLDEYIDRMHLAAGERGRQRLVRVQAQAEHPRL